MVHSLPEFERLVTFNTLHSTMVIAIDYKDERLLVGCRDGRIIDYPCYKDDAEKTINVWSHDNGEVWGLCDEGEE